MIRIVRAADARVVPWKNGRGLTRELAVGPDSATFERGDFDWRVSAAAVPEAGPFSAFPGIDRVLVVTSGDGLDLTHGDAAPPARVVPLVPCAFSGDWPTAATLVGGPVTDFNVLTRRGRATATVRVLRSRPADGPSVLPLRRIFEPREDPPAVRPRPHGAGRPSVAGFPGAGSDREAARSPCRGGGDHAGGDVGERSRPARAGDVVLLHAIRGRCSVMLRPGDSPMVLAAGDSLISGGGDPAPGTWGIGFDDDAGVAVVVRVSAIV